ncbi:MAG: hypothetical protein PUJ35_09875 [Ruminococcus bromii]|nr:hypothetical protein [Ruminococcus bromii]
MDEYIKRELAIKALSRGEGCENVCRRAIESILAADVAPVRHGRWKFGKDLPDSFGSISKNKYHLYCSECRNQAFNKTADNDYDFDMDTPFCPWCGAKMGGGDENG